MRHRARGRQGRNHGTAAPLALMLGLLLSAGGCAESPLAPLAPGAPEGSPVVAGGPEVLKLNPDGTTSFVPMPSGWLAPTPLPYEPGAVFDPRRRLSVTASIHGAAGGRLVCGNYVLTFPAGAFEGVGSVTMTLPDSTLMLCDLDVAPASLNAFLKPVDLALHTTGTDADLDSLQVYWWDEENSVQKEVPMCWQRRNRRVCGVI
jgi:hypothetical protein